MVIMKGRRGWSGKLSGESLIAMGGCPLAKHPRFFGIGVQNQFWLLPAERG
jgi:hypothetical protein